MKYLVYWQEQHVLEVEAENAAEAMDKWDDGELDLSYSEIVESKNVEVWDELARGKILGKE